MKRTITIAAYNRPQLLNLLLQSLKCQLHSLAEYKLHIRIDAGGDCFEGVKRVAYAVDFMDSDVSYPKKNEGVNLNTYALMEHVFEEELSDWNVYLEDDSLLSPDAFSLIEWYIEHGEEMKAHDNVDDIAAYCLLNLRGLGDPASVFLVTNFTGWCFLLDRYQWETYAKPAWCSSKELWGHEGMWDNSMARYIGQFAPAVVSAFPEISRVTNTGRVGVHCSPERYDRIMEGHTYNEARKAYDYRLSRVIWLGE